MIRQLLQLNGIAILGVIFYHAAGWGFTAMFAWAHRYLPAGSPPFSQVGSASYYALRAVEQLTVFSLPTFLFVSGVFIALATGRRRKRIDWKVVVARIRGLFIPYLLWTVILIVLLIVQGNRFSPGKLVAYLLTGRTNPAYYYVPLLLQLILLSPLLTYLAKRNWRMLLLGAGLLQLVVQLLYYPALLNLQIPWFAGAVDVIPKWLFVTRIFWFSLGIVAGFKISVFEQMLTRFRWYLLLLALVLLPLGILEWELMQRYSGLPYLLHRETILDSVYSLAVIFAALGFNLKRLPVAPQLNELGVHSYGIYLVHSPAMELAARVTYHLAPGLLAYQIVLQPIVIVAGLAIPLLLMLAVNRSPVRAYYKYSFG